MVNVEHNELEALIEKCLKETTKASREKYSSEEADRTAALLLEVQMKLSFYIEEVELKTKLSKNEVDRLEAEKYFEYKSNAEGKKLTENALTNFVMKDKEIVDIKNETARLESELKKWNYILNVLKDSHIFFRNSSKNKTWAE